MSMARDGVLVVGSANMDLVAKTGRFPEPGETLLGGTFGMFPGGKGANQAVASAKLGVRTYFVGKMGEDVFRDTLVSGMRRDGVDLRHLTFDPKESTGIALITVDKTGQNEIIVVSGANMRLLPADVDRVRGLFARVRTVLLQLEVPLPTVQRAAELAHETGATVILNPAPARELPTRLLRLVDILTPNETEAQILSGARVSTTASAERAARLLLDRGVKNVILTLGAKGCLLVTPKSVQRFPARKVRAVDTTAAGDAFNGALACALAGGSDLRGAIPFANAVAAFSVTRMGAQSSMPDKRTMRRVLGT